MLDRGGIAYAIAIKNLCAGKPSGKKTAAQGKGTMHAFHLSVPTCHARGGSWFVVLVAIFGLLWSAVAQKQIFHILALVQAQGGGIAHCI
jgi:hypothetical protein